MRLTDLSVIAPPDDPLFTFEELREHTVSDLADDDLLEGYLAAAVEWAERYLNQTLITSTLRLILGGFPDGPIRLPRGPVVRVDEVSYLSAYKGSQKRLLKSRCTLAGSLLTPARGMTWPETLDAPNAVSIEYMAGNEPEEVNPLIRQAILLKIGQMYLQREEVGPPHLRRSHMTAETLLDSVRKRQMG